MVVNADNKICSKDSEWEREGSKEREGRGGGINAQIRWWMLL